jgi:hypothetical protein
MPTPKAGYRLKDGTRVPGTTTIIGRFKDSGGLIHWAWEQGRDGLDYRATRDSAADAGTLGHWLVEQHIDGNTNGNVRTLFDIRVAAEKIPDDVAGKALKAYESYLGWEKQTKLKIVQQEMLLVSEVYKFGGTPDAVGEINGNLCILDWKTGNALYRDALIQVAAYKALWEENNPDRPITGGFHICRFSKDHGDFVHAHYDELDDAWRQFVLLREAYEIDKSLKKRAA